MGSIALIEKDEDVYYNGIYIYDGSGHIDAGGWGVRDRDKKIKAHSVLSLLYLAPTNADVTYVSFRVQAAGVPATDEVIFSIWKKKSTEVVFTQVYAYTINEAVIQAQYGAGVTFANDTIYTLPLPTAVHITPELDTSYYVAVYSSGCELDYIDDGSINGAYYVNADMSANPTYAIAAMTLSDYAVSFECFTEPDAWDKQLVGGAISEESIGWQNVLYCTSGVGEWANPTNIYGAGVSTSTANGDELYLDLGAGLVPVTPWDPSLASSQTDFPDDTAYGVRAVSRITVDADMGASGTEKIYVQINDSDTIAAPATGWQTVETIIGTNVVSYDFYVSSIVRWVRFVKGGTDTNQCTIDDVKVYYIVYPVTDGDYPINMVNASHNVWVRNYPTEVEIMKAAVKNMGGAESSPGLPFTNRENID